MSPRPRARLPWLAVAPLLLSLLALTLPVLAAPFQQEDSPTPAPNPYDSPLPTPRPIPNPAWRPAPYPVPWALTENDHFYFTRPLAVNEINWPLDVYRYTGTNFGSGLPHTGIDIVAPTGSAVLAAAAGQVIWADWGLFRLTPGDITDPYGQAVVIAHEFGLNEQPLFTVYAHLSEVNVVRGQQVSQGEVIGKVGDTGLATSAHLHFEVRLGANDFYSSLNPELWLAPPQGWGVLAGRIMTTWGEPVFGQTVRVTNLDTRQVWRIQSYNTFKNINRDPYYNENLVLSDLPAGNYELSIDYVGRTLRTSMRVEAGAVSFFTFYGFRGFNPQAEMPFMPTTLPDYQPSPTP